MTRRRIDVALAVFFTVIGLIVTIDMAILTYRFNDYVNQTVDRDAAQEKCVGETLDILHEWWVARLKEEQAERGRDQVLNVMLEQLQEGRRVDPATAKVLKERFVETEIARQNLENLFLHRQLPSCPVRGG